MAQLNITNLHCVKTRDGIGQKDEVLIYLALDGGSEFALGPWLLDKSNNGEDVNPGIVRHFTARAVVRLEERNGSAGGGNDDLNLGSDGFGPNVQEARNITFSGNNGRVVYTARIGVSA